VRTESHGKPESSVIDPRGQAQSVKPSSNRLLSATGKIQFQTEVDDQGRKACGCHRSGGVSPQSCISVVHPTRKYGISLANLFHCNIVGSETLIVQMKTSDVILVLAVSALPLSSGMGQILFSEDFDSDHTANWVVNAGPSDHAADFFFDYSTVGIPSAPHSGGTTLGARLQANQVNGIFSGFSVSPIGQSFAGDYQLRLDMWLSFNGPAPGGGSGSTQIGGAGIGTAGTSAQWPGGVQDSVWFAATGDGNSSADYRAYSSAASVGYADASGVFAAGSRNASDSYYAAFGGNSAPEAQLDLFSQQSGSTGAGVFGWAWRDVSITKLGDTITWTVDGLLIATVDASTVSLGGGNILLMYSDINATSSSDPNDVNLLFGLYDNVVVTAIPEPSSGALVLLGGTLFGLLRRRQKHG